MDVEKVCSAGMLLRSSFPVDDYRETEVQFKCLKEAVIAHRAYLQGQLTSYF